MIVDFTRW